MNRALVALVAALALGSCKLNDYCLECGQKDAGQDATDAAIDSNIDASPCVPTGDEICNGLDDDCDGLIDEGTLPGVGDLCPNQVGECAGGMQICAPTFHCSVTINVACFGATDMTTCPVNETCKADPISTDHITCDKNPKPEVCNGKDDNCNGMVDEGDPGSGARCGNGTGTCVQGVMHCDVTPGSPTQGSLVCVGGIGPVMEVCDGLDNDCDGVIDDNLGPLGSCGTSNVGRCKLGMNACVGGNIICQGAVGPGLEVCNGLDDDCDGQIDEDFNLATDANNCGACNHVCGATLPNDGNATWTCTAGTCAIAQCNSGYHDNNSDPTDGCEFGPCFNQGPEVCDGVDNDCDGTIDESADIGAPPPICAFQGECIGTVASCPCRDTPDAIGCSVVNAGWACKYPSDVQVDSNGNILPETSCDNLDEDCNGIIDDNQPNMEHADCAAYAVGDPLKCPFTGPACDDGKLGVCRGTGNFVCNMAMPTGPAVCSISSPGQMPSAETCNNTDDDCDGVIDEGSSTGNLPGQTWIAIGGGHQMMQFEGARPDATAADAGVLTAATCTQETLLASPGGATEAGTTATFTTSVAHGLAVGQRVTVAGVTVAGYNGTYLVAAVPSATTFTVTLATSGLAASGGGTIAMHCPIAITAASETGAGATFTTTSAHGFTVGQAVIVAGVGVAGYNGTWVISGVTATTFSVVLPTTGLASSSGGTAATNGVATCSKQNVQPWVNLTYPQALAACQSIGATLCTDQQWHRACSADSSAGNLPTVYPVSTNGTGLLLEAEDYFAASFATDTGGTTRSWVEDETPGFFGISDMLAQPNTGGNITSANAPAQAPRLDYEVTFSSTGTYHACVHMYAANANDNSIFVGVNATTPGTANGTALTNACGTYPCWAWISSANLSVTASPSPQFVSLYMAKDGTRVDALYIIKGNCPGGLTNTSENGVANTKGFQWAMQPTTGYTANVCNDMNYTGAGNGAPLATGSLASCYADDSGLVMGSTNQKAFDLSGNVKEWTFAHQPGQDPIRGGAFGDTQNGVDCPLDFLLANDAFFFPDVGFRCCR